MGPSWLKQKRVHLLEHTPPLFLLPRQEELVARSRNSEQMRALQLGPLRHKTFFISSIDKRLTF